jgi:Na+-transporting methylmalonyl-CoA/oxaloacetate decarboxylase gamma subunit
MAGFIVCMVVLFLLLAAFVWIMVLQRRISEDLKEEIKHNAEEINKENNNVKGN